MNAYEMLGRAEKVERIIAAMDRHAGHPMTAEEAGALSCEAIFAILKAADAVGSKKPSAETMQLVHQKIKAREVNRGRDPFRGF